MKFLIIFIALSIVNVIFSTIRRAERLLQASLVAATSPFTM